MLENIGIRTKVLGVVVLTAAIGTVAAANLSTLGTDRAVGSVMTSLLDLGPAATALQTERDLTLETVDLDPDSETGAALARARGVSRTSLTAVGRSLGGVDADALPDAAARAVTAARATPIDIAQVRQQVDDGDVSAVEVRGAYDSAIRALVRVPGAVALSQDDRDLSLDLMGWVQGREVMALTDVEVTRITDALEGDAPDAVQAESLYALAVRRDVLRSAFVSDIAATGVSVPPTADSLSQVRALLLNATTVAGIADAGVGDGPVQAVTAQLDAETVRDAAREEQQLLTAATDQLVGAAQVRSNEIITQSRRDLVSRVSVVAALVALVMGLALVVADGIVRRLRRVTVAADTMREQLPAAVAAAAASRGAAPAVASVGDVAGTRHGRDEVGRLASALDDVGALALDLAAGQARLRASVSDAFVSVARRNQSLLDRQLGAIDVLERDETDAAALSKLFELDHTTARMRRNAESLLVIAGVEGGRRARNPMPLIDVVRTAASGVEHYDRVEVALDGAPTVLPHAALPLAHLVAELLDNATSFSAPSTPVAVSARAQGGGVLLTIADSGTGMDEDELAAARARLADTSHAALVDASRLGLTVVARLARRLGVGVRLSSRAEQGPSRGTVVEVRLPVDLFADGTAPAQPAPQGLSSAGGSETVQGAATPPATAVEPDRAQAVVDQVAAEQVAGRRERSPEPVTTPIPTPVAPQPVLAAAAAAEPGPEPATRRAARHRVERRRWWTRKPQHARPTAQWSHDDGAPATAPTSGTAPTPAVARQPAPAAVAPGAEPWATTSTEEAAPPAARPTRVRPTAPTRTPVAASLPTGGEGYRPVRGTAKGSRPDASRGSAPLPRRTPAARTGAPAAPPSRAEAVAAAGDPASGDLATRDRAPGQVRSTLAGFRAGVERARAQASASGSAPTSADSGLATQDDTDDTDVIDVIDVIDVREDSSEPEHVEAGAR